MGRGQGNGGVRWGQGTCNWCGVPPGNPNTIRYMKSDYAQKYGPVFYYMENKRLLRDPKQTDFNPILLRI